MEIPLIQINTDNYVDIMQQYWNLPKTLIKEGNNGSRIEAFINKRYEQEFKDLENYFDKLFQVNKKELINLKDLSGTKLKAEGVTILPLGIINLDNKLQTIKDGNAATITLNRDEIKQLSSAYGKLFKTEDGYEQVLSIFKKYGEINETMFKK